MKAQINPPGNQKICDNAGFQVKVAGFNDKLTTHGI